MVRQGTLKQRTVYLPSKAASTLLLRFKLAEETLGRIEEFVRGPPVDEGGLVKLINNSNEAPTPAPNCHSMGGSSGMERGVEFLLIS